MSNTIKAFLNTQPAENHILYSLLFFLNFENENGNVNVDAPISDIEEDTLVLAVSLFETHQGIDVPDSYLTENKSKSIRQLADEIRELPKLSDDAFFKKLKEIILSWQTVIARN
jgi:hypothetical protein